MARASTSFACTACGQASLRWMGRCPGCGEWNTLVEQAGDPQADRRVSLGAGRAAGRSSRALARRRLASRSPLAEVEPGETERLRTGSDELDRVLGGGLVPGSVVLIGGSPGIGKSTLMSAALASIQGQGRSTLYVSGEESAAQVRLRAERLGAHALAVPVLAETSLEVVLASLEQERPQACVVDSVQTLWSSDLTGAPGSVGQVQEVAAALERFAREHGCAVILVGHVTKEGTLAGPRVLEHAVDCVLQFEGERERSFRTLRALKNRFGSTNEIGVFEMRAGGLTEVADPSDRFLREAEPVAGLLRALRDGGHAPPARGGPGAGRADRGRAAAAGRERHRPQPAEHGPRRPGPARWAVAGVRGRVRERRRRRAHRGAGRRPGGRAGGRLGGTRSSRWHGAGGPPPASARSASPGSCATSPTPTAASRRRPGSASSGW